MDSDATLKIPTVDLSRGNLKPGSHAWNAARSQIKAALDTFGCFEAVYDGVRPELRDAAFRAAKELFALPMEAKLRNLSDMTYRGYLGQIPGLPYESLEVEDVLGPAAARGFTHLMWPQGNPTFCETVSEFAEKAAELERVVRRMLLESLDVDKSYDSHMEMTKYALRFSQYAAPIEPGAGGLKLALPSHVDGSMSTLIFQKQVDGLEVQARSGDWVPFMPSSPNAFVFLIGDAFRAWSNDRLFSTPHRVRVGGGEARHTVLLFAVPKDEAVIETPAELVDDLFPPRFRPYRIQDYVNFLAASQKAEGGGDPTSILPAFCGTMGGGGEPQIQP